MIFSSNPFTDAIFIYEGIDWLRWLVAFFFFLLGLFGGWWKWGYRRQPAAKVKAKPAKEEKPKLKLEAQPDPKEEPEAEIQEQWLEGTTDSDFGRIFVTQPDETDDLQQLRGIGKALRAKLFSLGIYRFEQIANWGEPEIAAISKKLQLVEQIEKDRWVEQARERSDKK